MIKIIREFGKKVIVATPILYDWVFFHQTYPYVSFLKYLWKELQVLCGVRLKDQYFPYDKNSTVHGNILVGNNVKVTQRGGCYVQGWGSVFLGDYTVIAQNSIITSANHSLTNHDVSVKKEVIIGDHCWFASNVCVMGGHSWPSYGRCCW